MADTFAGYFARNRALLESGLRDCKDATEAEECALMCFDRMQREYVQSETDPDKRGLAAELFGVAKSAIACMLSVTEADVFFHAPQTPPPRAGVGGYVEKWKKYLPYIGPGLCAIITLATMLTGQTALGITSLLATAATGYQTWSARGGAYMSASKRQAPALPSATAVPRANNAELPRRLERLALAMDAAMERALSPADSKAAPVSLNWTSAQLEAVQMLWEASVQSDGGYALKTVPQLMLSLEQAGIRPETYSPACDRDFDKLPGVQDGYTVRPALYAGDRLVMRGQVTQAMRKRAAGA